MAVVFKLSGFSKFVLAAIGLLVFNASSVALAQVNQNDVNYTRDNERIRKRDVMNAQMLMRGIACETGACFSTATDDLGYDTTPLIDVDGNTDPSRVKPGDITR